MNIDIASSVLPFLNLSPGSERFSSLRNLYVYIESDDPKRRPRRVVELVDLTEDAKWKMAGEIKPKGFWKNSELSLDVGVLRLR